MPVNFDWRVSKQCTRGLYTRYSICTVHVGSSLVASCPLHAWRGVLWGPLGVGFWEIDGLVVRCDWSLRVIPVALPSLCMGWLEGRSKTGYWGCVAVVVSSFPWVRAMGCLRLLHRLLRSCALSLTLFLMERGPIGASIFFAFYFHFRHCDRRWEASLHEQQVSDITLYSICL